MNGGTMLAGAPPPLQHQAPDQHDSNKDNLALFRLHALQTRGDWSAHDDGDGRLFYYNAATKASQWEPPAPFAGIEGELMMALMLQHAVARSGFWTAHDAGHGTLYYFNERTRVSVWQRPEEWGVLPPPPPPAQDDSDGSESVGSAQANDAANRADTAVHVHKEPDSDTAASPLESKPVTAKQVQEREQHSTSASAAPADSADGSRSPQSEATASSTGEPAEHAQAQEEDEVEEEEPPTAEELAAAAAKEAAERKRIESFRQMLRDKKVMPFTKWSAAMPRIVSDPRFMAIATMDERRAIFEHFVQHRRDDLKAEKKATLTAAKKTFTALLREQLAQQLADSTWSAKTSLPVFLSTLEHALDAARLQHIRESAMALLPTSVQEKLFEKAMAEASEQASKIAAEEAELAAFVRAELTTAASDLRDARWENSALQALVTSFYTSKRDARERLLSSEQQRGVVRRVQLEFVPAQPAADSKYGGSAHRSEAPDDQRERQPAPQSVREVATSRSHGRPRDRSRSRSTHGHRARSRSRGRASERDDGTTDRRRHGDRSSRRHSSSSSSSRSRSRSRSRRGSRSHRHRSRSRRR